MGPKVEPVVDSFPFPYQPTPPAMKHSSLHAIGHDSTPLDECPYLTNVGNLTGAIVTRGGFGESKELYEPAGNGMRCFPPPPNAAYDLTSQAHCPKDATNITFKVYLPKSTDDEQEDRDFEALRLGLLPFTKAILPDTVNNLDGTASPVQGASPAKEEDEKDPRSINELIYNPSRRQQLTLSMRRPATGEREDIHTASTSSGAKTRGELLAETINFNRATWVMTSPGVSGPIYPPEEQRADFIANIDTNKAEFEYCSKCKTKHIPPGAPITLQDRDTCGSYLPEWFPTEEFDQPWSAFTRLMNDMVYLEEIGQGHGHRPNPDVPEWNLHFHDYSSRWRAIGKRGGWWKCRDGEDATDVERDCQVCHNKMIEGERDADAAKRGRSVAERLTSLHEFMAEHMKKVGERDQEIALARIRAEGFPQYLGPRTIEEERFRNPVLSRTGSMPSLYRHYSIDSTTSLVGYGSPVGGCSPIRRTRH